MGCFYNYDLAFTFVVLRRVCKTRTLVKGNSYDTVANITIFSPVVKSAALALASAYTPGSLELDATHTLNALAGLRGLLGSFTDNPASLLEHCAVSVIVAMLLIHKEVVQEGAGWVGLSNILVVLQQYQRLWPIPTTMFVIYQLILAVFDHGEIIHAGVDIAWLTT